jgi:UDP-N-acetyl-D-glucosamine dehydrogenase
VELMELLQERGAVVAYNDPHVPVLPPLRGHAIRLQSSPLTPELLQAQDCVLIATDHRAFDWDFIVKHARLVVDTRGATRRVANGGKTRIVMA